VRRAISKVLSASGFNVVTAGDVKPALELAAATHPEIVVVDFNMPTCGLEVVRQLKANGANVFIAVLTGEDCETTRERCLRAGADAVLTKPIPPIELRARLAAAAVVLKQLPAAS
jgi:two-component system KDP operon response regulator KdpE